MDNIVNVIQESRTIAAKIEQLMAKQGLSRRDVAMKIGVSPQLVGSIINEQRNVSVDVLVRLALLFNVSTDYLLNLTVIDDAAALQRLKDEKASLEKQAQELQASMAEAGFGREFKEKLRRVQELSDQIIYLDACIKRSQTQPLRISDTNSATPIYRPLDNMGVDSAILVGHQEADQLGVPEDTILYLKKVDRATPGKPYAVRYGDQITLTATPENPTEVLGEIIHALIPAQVFANQYLNG